MNGNSTPETGLNQKMTLNKLKAKLDLIPDELRNAEVILVQYKGEEELSAKPDTVCIAKARTVGNHEVILPIHDPKDNHKANAVVIAST